MTGKGHLPIRRCMGCGGRKRKDEMVRLVRTASGQICVSPRHADGRGFYLCPDPGCLKMAQKKARRSGLWESVDLDLLRSRISQMGLKTEQCRRNRDVED